MFDFLRPDFESLSRKTRRRILQAQAKRRNVVSSVQFAGNLSADTDRQCSPNIWSQFNALRLVEDPTYGCHFFDDFLYMQSEDGTDDVYFKYIDTSNTIRLVAQTATVVGGEVALVTDATDNDAPVLAFRGANAGGGNISSVILGNSSTASFLTLFETRLKKSSITDNQCAFFAGLAEATARAADDGLLEDDTGDIVNSISAIGFRAKHDNGEELDFVYQDAAQTAPTEVIANIQAMVADTYIKLGFVYNPLEENSKKIKIYVNGVEQSTYVTTTNIDAATFPENDAMTPTFGSKNGEATATTLTIDWWRLAQVYRIG